MHPLSLALGFVVGAAAMAVYNLAHNAKVTKLGQDIMAEFTKLKSKI